MNLTLVVPVYNEELRFNDLYFRSILTDSEIDLIFVNDGSRDKTEFMLGNFQASIGPRVKIVSLETNQGKATAIRLGMIEGWKHGRDWVGFLDADGAFPIEVVEDALFELSKVSDDIQSVWFSRVMLAGAQIERNWARHFLGRLIITLITFGLPNCPYDTQAGFKVFRRNLIQSELWEHPFKTRWLFDVEIFLLLSRLGLSNSIKEIPVNAWEDKVGSKLRFWSSLRIAKEMVSIWKLRSENLN